MNRRPISGGSGGGGLLQQGATFAGEIDDPGSTVESYTIEPSAYAPDVVVAAFYALENDLPDGLNRQNTGLSFEVWDMVEDQNQRIQRDEKRRGLWPCRFNIFPAFDFEEGRLKNWPVGSGWRWQGANIIGEDPDGNEVQGKGSHETDRFLRCRLNRFAFTERGRWPCQMNLYELLDKRALYPGNRRGDQCSFQTIPGDRAGGLPALRSCPAA